MKLTKSCKTIILIFILGLIIYEAYKEYTYDSYYLQDLIELSMNNAKNTTETVGNDKDNIAVRYKFDKTLSEKENILIFLENMNCTYFTEEEHIPLGTIVRLIEYCSTIENQKKKTFYKFVGSGGSFSVGEYDVEYMSYSPYKERGFSSFEILYTNYDEIVYSRVFVYGNIIRNNTDVEEEFKIAMGIL